MQIIRCEQLNKIYASGEARVHAVRDVTISLALRIGSTIYLVRSPAVSSSALRLHAHWRTSPPSCWRMSRPVIWTARPDARCSPC